MQIVEIQQQADLDELKQRSFNQSVVIFKHSTRCAISSMVYSRLKRSWDGEIHEDQELYYLDLIRYRPLSDALAADYGVTHESPQVLIIKDGNCIFNASHNAINVSEIKDFT